MGKTLIDTNVVIDFLNRKLPRAGYRYVSQEFKKGLHLSVITKIELLTLNVGHGEEAILKNFISSSKLLSITDDVVEMAIRIGKPASIKIPDAIIASTALVNRLDLITRNVKDFRMVEGLKVINPWILT